MSPSIWLETRVPSQSLWWFPTLTESDLHWGRVSIPRRFKTSHTLVIFIYVHGKWKITVNQPRAQAWLYCTRICRMRIVPSRTEVWVSPTLGRKPQQHQTRPGDQLQIYTTMLLLPPYFLPTDFLGLLLHHHQLSSIINHQSSYKNNSDIPQSSYHSSGSSSSHIPTAPLHHSVLPNIPRGPVHGTVLEISNPDQQFASILGIN